MRPLWVGGLIAPLAAPVAFFLVLLVLSVTRSGWAPGTQDWEAGVMAAVAFVLPVSYFATWLLGMPCLYWLQRKSQLSTFRVCTLAILFGMIAMWAFQLIGANGQLDLAHVFYGGLIGAALAVCVALLLCWVVGIKALG